MSAGRVGILATPDGAGSFTNGSVRMFPGNASIVHTLTDNATTGSPSNVVATTRVLENNAIVATLVCTSKSGRSCPVTLLLSDTNENHYNVDQEAGAAADSSVVWWRKENIHEALNPASASGSCDPHMPLQSVERTFAVDAHDNLAMANGSCLWYDPVTSPGMITSGDCTQPQGGWKWAGNASQGDIVHTASSTCLTSSLVLGACGATPWAQSPSGSANASHVYLSNTKGCIVVRPDNNNNTLGVALGVADASGVLVRGKTARVSITDASAGVTLSLSLKSGDAYTVLVGLQTLRDIG